jgi:class 3 adenylate cyclase
MERDPDIFRRLLDILREYGGWETALRRLEAEIQTAPDPDKRALLQQFRGWMAAERGEFDEAIHQLQQTEQVPSLAGWAVYGQAFVAHRRKAFAQAHQLLDRAVRLADSTDTALRARIALLRGTVFFHEGKSDQALPLLHEALELAGRKSYVTGRVLDALGMVYAGKDNFHAAIEFYRQAIQLKQEFGDDAGLALSHGQLGRLYLDWGYLDRAEEQFKNDLDIARRIGDDRGMAQMYNHLGQVALARGDGRTAADWLDEAIRLCQAQADQWSTIEAFARKDRALACLGVGDVAGAEAQIRQAEELCRAAGFAEGLAHVDRVWGMVRRAQGRHSDAEKYLRSALGHFEGSQERVESARTQLEVARTLRAQGSPRPPVAQALLAALETAESCRRAVLVREIGQDLRAVDETKYWHHAFRRVRGRDFPEDNDSLVDGLSEPVSVMFFDLKGSTELGRITAPEIVMATLNQMLADLEPVLRNYKAHVTSHLGDGFMALLRGPDHAPRAVAAALGLMAALREFNRPRKVLDLPPFSARVGIATGGVSLGNVGTYHKLDYTAIGHTVNLAARLQGEAEEYLPCINRETYQLVAERFKFKSDQPRPVNPKGIGACDVWDVIGHKE